MGSDCQDCGASSGTGIDWLDHYPIFTLGLSDRPAVPLPGLGNPAGDSQSASGDKKSCEAESNWKGLFCIILIFFATIQQSHRIKLYKAAQYQRGPILAFDK